ncbi:hypothetical protein LPJ66_011381, partial [Kickxella alabastrina]
HRLGVPGGDGNGSSKLRKRSFHEQETLATMIDDGTFHVQLRAYNTTYSLVVEPNHDLVHPEAVMTRTMSNGKKQRTSIPTHDIGIYRGHVLRVGEVQPREVSESLRKWDMFKEDRYSFDEQQSWARLSIFKDIWGQAVIDGVFGYGGETFYVKPAAAYMRTKRDGDPMLSNPYARGSEELRLARTIVYRQSDL